MQYHLNQLRIHFKITKLKYSKTVQKYTGTQYKNTNKH